ncbi:MAG: protein kinase [Chthoniobacterales bacterium]|nr:protein kinase [Chthoniobacterales bacterium]
MPNKVHICRTCGSKLFADAPQGLCGACLFRSGLSLPGKGEESSSSKPTPAPKDFQDYELLEEIGRGGQGVVYRAWQKSLNRTVALKVIGLGGAATQSHLRRFRFEAEAAAGLNHPSIVPIHEIGELEGCCYFSMNLIEGGRLDHFMKGQPMPIRRAAELGARLARTVHYAHERGILHRDIKPGNILLDCEGAPYLTDFGLARLIETDNDLTRPTEMLGTPSYAAPEQARGNNVLATRATDIYGLGAVLYHLLTGRPPFSAPTAYETIRMVLEENPPWPRLLNPQADHDLATICLKCLEKEPSLRYASALELAEDLERWLRHEPIHARRIPFFVRGKKWLQRNPTSAVAAASLTGLVIALGIILWKIDWFHPPPSASIAVLPFANLSGNEESAFFADGVQDDILTKLAKIADLKVISSGSVLQYRSARRNLHEIGKELHVSKLLEGSVRQSAGRVHINAQLVDAGTDRHVWAEEYDRDLKDLFALQTEIALEVATQLHARISAAEKRAIERAPTADLGAFDLANRARDIFLAATNSNSGKENLFAAADLLNQALARDPSYFEAYCQLAAIHDLLYVLGHDHRPYRLSLAQAAVDKALLLRPQAGEAHVARATHLYSGYLDYTSALAELDLARRSLPNDSSIFELRGLILKRQGEFEEAIPQLQHAMELDPRNVYRLEQIASSYYYLRRYAEAEAVYDRARVIEPLNVQLMAASASLDLTWKADTRALHRLIDSLRENNPRALHEIADSWMACALADRDVSAIKAALIVAGENTPLNDNAIHFNRSFIEGWVARLSHNESDAQAAFAIARAEQEKIVQAEPEYAPSLCVLGVIDAALGRKEEALSECRRAVELLPIKKDALNGPLMIQWYAISAAWVGEKELALQELAGAAQGPGTLSYGWLKLVPFCDPLRDDPRFEKIIDALAPRE